MALCCSIMRWRQRSEFSSICAASNQPRALLDRFLRFPALAHTDELDENRCRSRLAGGLRAELTVVAPKDYVATLHAQTGSRRHITKLQRLARSKAMTLYPEVLESGNEIYRRLCIQYITRDM